MTAEIGSEQHSVGTISPTLEKQLGTGLSTGAEEDEETSDELSSSDNSSEPDKSINRPSLNKPRVWDSERDLRCFPRQSSMARMSSIKNGTMVCVEEWLDEKSRGLHPFDALVKPETSYCGCDTEENPAETSDPDWERRCLDLQNKYNELLQRANSLSTDFEEAVELLREEHQALKELEEDHIKKFHELEEAKATCERLQNENSILRKRLIRKNHENYELQSQLDSANSNISKNSSKLENGGTLNSKTSGQQSSLPVPSNTRTQFRRSKSAWTVQRNPLEMQPDSPTSLKPTLTNTQPVDRRALFQRSKTAAQPFDRRAQFQRSKSSWSAQRCHQHKSQSKLNLSPTTARAVLSPPSSKSSWTLPRDPLETLSEVTQKDCIMKWFHFNMPSLEEEVGDEAQRLKQLVASGKSQAQRLDRQYLHVQSMRNLNQ